MININIDVSIKNKIASLKNDAEIVCGNSDYVINFDFSEEWNAETEKTARFIFGGGYYEDVNFSGNSCNAPIISNAREVLIGVYAGELKTTTPARVKCIKSVLCDDIAGTETERVIVTKGDKGEKGDKGDRGEKGETGADGVRGKDGASAYEIAVKNGFDGTESEWLESLKESSEENGSFALKEDVGEIKSLTTNNKSSIVEAVNEINENVDEVSKAVVKAIEDVGADLNRINERIDDVEDNGSTERPTATITGNSTEYFMPISNIPNTVSLHLYNNIYEGHEIKNLWFNIDGTKIDVKNLSALDGNPYVINMDKLITSPLNSLLHVVTLCAPITFSDFISNLGAYVDYEFELEIYL